MQAQSYRDAQSRSDQIAPDRFYSTVHFSGPMEVSDIQVRFGEQAILAGLADTEFARQISDHLNDVLRLAQDDPLSVLERPADLRRYRTAMLWLCGVLSHLPPLLGFCVFTSEGMLIGQTKPHLLQPLLELLGFGIPIAGCLPTFLYYGRCKVLTAPGSGLRRQRKEFCDILFACGLAVAVQAVLFTALHGIVALGG